jgi:hypothetical protein
VPRAMFKIMRRALFRMVQLREMFRIMLRVLLRYAEGSVYGYASSLCVVLGFG